MRIELCRGLRALSHLAVFLGATPQDIAVDTVSGIATDSGEVMAGERCVALRGARTSGVAHVAAALSKGAAAVLVSRGEMLPQKCPTLRTDNAQSALLRAAACYRRRLRGQLIAVSGSAGKTTVKEATAVLLSQKGSVAHSQGNFNSDIGLSLSLLSFEPCDFWVVEIGVSHPGEMAPMAHAAAPDLAVLTNVGSAHIGNYGSYEALLAEKAELLAHLRPKGRALIPADLPRSAFSCRDGALYRFGQDGDFHLEGITMGQKGTRGDLMAPYRVITNLNWPRAGKSGISVLETVGAIGILCGLEEDQIRRGLALAGESTPRMRELCVGGRLLIDDGYNASPEAMLEALRVLRIRAGGRPTVAVLGDMLELGARSEAMHAAVGRCAAEQRIDRLLAYGSRAATLARAAREAGMSADRVLHFDEDEGPHLLEVLCDSLPKDAVVLFKASGKMNMKALVEEAVKRI